MPYYGSDRCRGCSGEDCVCCEVYLESRADARSYEYDDPRDYYDDYDYDDEHDQFRDDVEADADVLRNCGWGTDEDYDHYGDDCDSYYE